MKTTTDALVIWENKTGEADRVITLLTPDGILSAYARNSLKPNNKLTSSTAMLSYSDFDLYPGKNMFTVDDAKIRHCFVHLFTDVEGYALSAYFCDLLRLLAPVGDDASAFLSLMLNALAMINEDKRPKDIIKSVFELKILEYAGYAPDIHSCRNCGAEEDTPGFFDLLDSTWLCRRCCAKKEMPLNCAQGAIAAIRHILNSALSKAFAFELGESALKNLVDLCEHYTIAKVEKKLDTLDFYKTLQIS